jgi:spore coat protein U-like protein
MNMRYKSLVAVALTATVAMVGSVPAIAGSTSSNISVTATVNAQCTVTTGAVAFGTYNPLTATNNDATGSLSVTCTNGTAWTAAAGAGTGTGATLASRKMTSGSNLLNYVLYTDSGRTTVWGDGTSSTATVGATGTGAAQSTTIYGRLPGSQSNAAVGSYADTVAVTVAF